MHQGNASAAYRRLVGEASAPTLFAAPSQTGEVEYIRVLSANQAQLARIIEVCSELDIPLSLDHGDGLIIGDRIPF